MRRLLGGDPLLMAILQLGDTQVVGDTQYGFRRVLDVTGGTFGSNLVAFQGTVVSGGFDFELKLSNGVIEQEQVGVLRTSDGTSVYMRTCGVAPADSSEVRIVPEFEVANTSDFSWLNGGKYAGTRTIDAAAGTMKLEIYRVSDVSTASNRVQITKPAGVPSQPWECGGITERRSSSAPLGPDAVRHQTEPPAARPSLSRRHRGAAS